MKLFKFTGFAVTAAILAMPFAVLAQGLYLEDPQFVEYLEYLRSYWKQPKYAQYLLYPACLKFLDLVLDHPEFRKLLKDPLVCDAIFQQQFQFWQNRLKLQL